MVLVGDTLYKVLSVFLEVVWRVEGNSVGVLEAMVGLTNSIGPLAEEGLLYLLLSLRATGPLPPPPPTLPACLSPDVGPGREADILRSFRCLCC